jgi:hypothetical protein
VIGIRSSLLQNECRYELTCFQGNGIFDAYPIGGIHLNLDTKKASENLGGFDNTGADDRN